MHLQGFHCWVIKSLPSARHGPKLVKAITTQPLTLDILAVDSGDLSGLDESAVAIARAIVD